jgi:hypothetical protein
MQNAPRGIRITVWRTTTATASVGLRVRPGHSPDREARDNKECRRTEAHHGFLCLRGGLQRFDGACRPVEGLIANRLQVISQYCVRASVIVFVRMKAS